MRGKGICYDTGFVNRGVSTHLGRTYPDMAWEPKAACTALLPCKRPLALAVIPA